MFANAQSDYVRPKPANIEWTQNIGGQLPLDTPLRDTEDRPVKLGDYFNNGPVILMLGYNRCPMLCGEQIQALLQAFKATSLQEIGPFSVLFLSVDPNEPTTLTREAEKTAQGALARTGATADWTFLRGSENAIRQVTDRAGFAYHEDAESEQFAHPAGFLVVQSDGTISRYLFGVKFESRDLRLALVDAGRGKVGQVADQLLLICFQYDPLTGKYGLAISRGIKGGSLLTLIGLGVWIGGHLRKERRTVASR